MLLALGAIVLLASLLMMRFGRQCNAPLKLQDRGGGLADSTPPLPREPTGRSRRQPGNGGGAYTDKPRSGPR